MQKQAFFAEVTDAERESLLALLEAEDSAAECPGAGGGGAGVVAVGVEGEGGLCLGVEAGGECGEAFLLAFDALQLPGVVREYFLLKRRKQDGSKAVEQ